MTTMPLTPRPTGATGSAAPGAVRRPALRGDRGLSRRSRRFRFILNAFDNARSASTAAALDHSPRGGRGQGAGDPPPPGHSRLIDNRAAIAVLGPDAPPNASIVAEVSRQLGYALAGAGYHVIVAGSGITSDAVARAALDRAGRVRAVSLVLEEPPADAVAPGLEVVTAPSVFQRTEAVVAYADALIALPGDLHALAAVLQVWAWGQTLDGPYRPLILLGDRWPTIVKSLADAAALDRRTRAMVTFTTTPEEAVETLRYYISPK